MRFKKIVNIGGSCLKARFFNKKSPVFISWSITERCNLRCKYCHAWRREQPELSTHEVLKIINALSKMGTKMIRLTGGEPLLRGDIVDIVNHIHDLDILVTVSTNGILFPDKIKGIKKLNGVSISLDGPEQINDSVRGAGSYKKAMEALDSAHANKVPISISTTLTSLNLSSTEYLLNLAKRFNAKTFFQPATDIVLFGRDHNPISPDVNQYRAVISSLVELKKQNKFIGNSIPGLKHLYHWPDKKAINCVAGKIIFRMDSQGNVEPCSRFAIENNRLNIIEKGLKYCLNQLDPPDCGRCWCSSLVELNLISKFNINAIINAFRW